MFRTIIVLAAVLALAVPVAAAAQSPLEQERYYSSYGEPAQSDSLAQERYYSSYGEPEPAAAPAADAAPADDDAPWKALALVSGALVLALAAAEAVTLARLRRAT
jgi:hypothetical protein